MTLTIDEGDPVIVKSIDYQGFDVIPEPHLRTVKNDAPLKVNKPRDKALVLTTREMALNELRDHGYPYATVKVDEDDGASGLEARLTFVGEPGKIAHFGPTSVQGNESVSDLGSQGRAQGEAEGAPGNSQQRVQPPQQKPQRRKTA